MVAEFQEEQHATHGHFVWAAKDKFVEMLSEGAPLIKRAPRYLVYLLATLSTGVSGRGRSYSRPALH